jgi:hypothetical protein
MTRDKLNGNVVSVFGPFASRALIELPVDVARELFGDPLTDSRRSNVIEAVERDIEAIRKRDAALADSGLAASAIALAYELEHPYNSATSKAMCAGKLHEALDKLRELTPAGEERDKVTEIEEQRERRRNRRAAAADLPRP